MAEFEKKLVKCLAVSAMRRIFASSNNQSQTKSITMENFQKTELNVAIAKALTKVSEMSWVGCKVYPNMEMALAVVNHYSMNSGLYKPPMPTRINGVTGWFMINQDGSIFCDARIIKEDNNKFRVEYMTNSAWNEFERLCVNILEQQ